MASYPGPSGSVEERFEPPSSRLRVLWRGLTRACPVCSNRRGLFERGKLVERCPRCRFRFERQAGHFIGGVTMNTVFTFGLGFVAMMAWIVLSYPDLDIAVGLAVLIPVGTVFPWLFYPTSQTLWTAVDIAMRPVAADEIGSRQPEPVARPSSGGGGFSPPSGNGSSPPGGGGR